MTRVIVGLLTAFVLATTFAQAQAVTPFKLGTFLHPNAQSPRVGGPAERAGRAFVGVVLREAVVIDFAAAHAAIQTPASKVAPPSDMKDLIVRYDQGLRTRILDIVRSVEAAGANRPAYVFDVTAVKILPPVMPTTMLNVAVNYAEHDREAAVLLRDQIAAGPMTLGAALPGTRSAPGIWERARDDTRWNPYMFIKLPSTIIAEGEAIRLPPGRTQIDWECELGVVIGRQASGVPAAQSASYIFGYTIQNDVSDRGGRGDTRYGTDWLVAKNHDTFGPLGPFITPKEFVANPQKLTIRFTLNGTVMQEANTSFMIHDVYEQVTYASHIMTLRPGDIIATGTPAGIGSARTPPIYFKPGDRSVCTYESVGRLTNPVVGS